MPDYPPKDSSLDEAVAEVRREFDEGLLDRLDTLTTALGILTQGFKSDAAESFFFNAHSLKGTAGAFGADDLVPPARELSDRARRWLKQGQTSAQELTEAREGLERLREAVSGYLRG
jgi:HPt (histidine-containing phosphotransfer) domain-containing protein